MQLPTSFFLLAVMIYTQSQKSTVQAWPFRSGSPGGFLQNSFPGAASSSPWGGPFGMGGGGGEEEEEEGGMDGIMGGMMGGRGMSFGGSAFQGPMSSGPFSRPGFGGMSQGREDADEEGGMGGMMGGFGGQSGLGGGTMGMSGGQSGLGGLDSMFGGEGGEGMDFFRMLRMIFSLFRNGMNRRNTIAPQTQKPAPNMPFGATNLRATPPFMPIPQASAPMASQWTGQNTPSQSSSIGSGSSNPDGASTPSGSSNQNTAPTQPSFADVNLNLEVNDDVRPQGGFALRQWQCDQQGGVCAYQCENQSDSIPSVNCGWGPQGRLYCCDQ